LASYVDFASIGKAMLADGNWSKYALSEEHLEYPCRKCKRCMWFFKPEKCPAQLKR